MYCSYQDRQALEDDLYQEDGEESEGSEVTSELEFHLYSQLHYSSNTVDLEAQDGENQPSQEVAVPDKTAETAVNVELEDSAKNRPPSLNTVKLQQQSDVGEKQVKQKKGKSVPKDRRSMPGFDEVIIIDSSSSEVITLSESDSSSSDDDAGVCTLKGDRVHQVPMSTPAQKTQHKKKDISPVTLDSSSSESDPELEFKCDSESSLSSDSDVLENWMMLGQGKEDGDHFISLNLEGSTDSNADFEKDIDDSWVVSGKDMKAQIFNKDKRAKAAVSRAVHRYYTDKNVHCRNCDKIGHLSRNCPAPKKVAICFLCGDPNHQSSECPYKHCNNCGLPGHLYNSCSERPYYHKQCHRCRMTGHFFDACPEIWRQYHISTKTGPPLKHRGEDNGRNPAYCYNCSKKGHFGHGCTQQRMYRGTFAATPFINYYDTKKDIIHRESRMKIKAQAMKKSGLMPNNSQTQLTPGPPKKKQKISHANNSHLFDNKFDRTAFNHKASPRHIFFPDNNDSGAAIFPKRKFNKQTKQERTGKQWKPKRPVPRERPAPHKLIVDERVDFPRSCGGGEKLEKKRRKKKKKKSEKNDQPAELKDGSHCRTTPKKRKKDKHERKSGPRHKKTDTQMYSTDENLFNIKQRKCKR